MPKKFRNMLLVYPEFSPTYWGLQYSLPFIERKAVMPPLGLITIAALTPGDYEFKLVDMNCEPLLNSDLEWADIVLISAMIPQKATSFKAADRARRAGKLVVFGGPYPTACPEECKPHFDVLVMNEGEITWPMFLKDLEKGSYSDVYTSEEKPDITKSPCPRYDLLNYSYYAVIPIQFSRGCPFLCEFCDIIVMYGRVPRTKTSAQVLKELDTIYELGYRGLVFIVDDNFIGNKKRAKEFLPELKAWNEAHNHPYHYSTEASINLADDEALMKSMREAGLVRVFIGLESPVEDSLKEIRKTQNLKGSLLDKIKIIQKSGFTVSGGFILGFDTDPHDIFERQINFINETAIPSAMIGPLVALPGTPLFKRIKKEGRLLEDDLDEQRTVASGFTNIDTKMPLRTLLSGYADIVKNLYTPKNYFKRSLGALRQIDKLTDQKLSFSSNNKEQVASNWMIINLWQRIKLLLPLLKKFPLGYRLEASKFAFRVIIERPEHLGRAIDLIVIGYHYYMFTFKHVLPEIEMSLQDKETIRQVIREELLLS